MLVRHLVVIKECYSRNTVKMLVTLGLETKVIFHGSLDAKLLCTERGDVEVHLQDLPLGILLRQANRQGSLGKLALQRDLRIVREIFY